MYRGVIPYYEDIAIRTLFWFYNGAYIRFAILKEKDRSLHHASRLLTQIDNAFG